MYVSKTKQKRKEVHTMWLGDLEKAIADVKKTHPHTLVEIVCGCADGGVSFKTTYHTYIKWFPDGRVVERDEEAWRR
jgi:hypothetical protein